MRCTVFLLLLASLAGGPTVAANADDQPKTPAVRTGKERLTDKASDEQRVDDCKVPPARRTRARPTGCGLR
jgi:hypothetical protein